MRTKKSYGQHLLIDESIAQTIVTGIQTRMTTSNLLEIGPGTGVLTKYFLEGPFNFKAVEADYDMVQYLQRQFGLSENQLISKDVLKMDLSRVFNKNHFEIVGNFPYNISTQIIMRVLKYRNLIPNVVGMFQKEVGHRICSAPGSKVYGKTSVWAQAFYDCEILFDVGPESFDPPPRVQSVVIALRRKENYTLECDENLFFTVVKQAFSQRRKMLRNTLKSLFAGSDLSEQDFFSRRPETLSVEDFVHITQMITELRKDD
ncbi:MAG: ribosomal RNA small subunit methyltransferase A [Bacteroidia bacterium]|nr:ribosomal RNA small subunit methyltransferase A [Bacteroidia bacterium]